MSAKIHSLNDFLELLKGVKKARDGQYLALCPGHHDTKPSLSIKEADGKGGYFGNLKGIVPTLYHQDKKLRQAIDSATQLYLVEGEKDADRPLSP